MVLVLVNTTYADMIVLILRFIAGTILAQVVPSDSSARLFSIDEVHLAIETPQPHYCHPPPRAPYNCMSRSNSFWRACTRASSDQLVNPATCNSPPHFDGPMLALEVEQSTDYKRLHVETPLRLECFCPPAAFAISIHAENTRPKLSQLLYRLSAGFADFGS